MKFVKQLLIILSISFIAEILEYYIPLPVAASIYGLVLMLIGLVTGLIPLKEVEDAADFLVEIMPIMFVPATVGIMTSVEALKQMLVPLCVISIVSTVLVFGVTGRVTQGIIRRGNSAREMREPGEKNPDRDGTVCGGKKPDAEEAVQAEGGLSK